MRLRGEGGNEAHLRRRVGQHAPRGYVQNIIQEINSKESELMKTPSPYKKVVVPQTFRSKLKKYIPASLLNIVKVIKESKEQVGFIVE